MRIFKVTICIKLYYSITKARFFFKILKGCGKPTIMDKWKTQIESDIPISEE